MKITKVKREFMPVQIEFENEFEAKMMRTIVHNVQPAELVKWMGNECSAVEASDFITGVHVALQV